MLKQAKRITRDDIRQNNLLRVYNLMRRSGEMSTSEIAAELQLSLPTVAKNLSVLEKQNLVLSSDVRKNTGGRNSKLYNADGSVHVAVGVNITGHHISAVVINLQGHVVSQFRQRQVFARSDAYYRKIGEIVAKVVRESEALDDQILGVALVMPSLISQDRQHTYYNGVLGEEPVISCSELSAYIPYPTRFCHDGKAAAYAESWFNHDVTDFFYLMISDSIIGTPFLGGSPYDGLNQRSGEIGHIRMVRNGRRCYCGKRGCMETYCSTKALSDITDGNLAAYFDLLEKKDPQALERWDEYLRNISVAINAARMLFDCSIVIGGYLGQYMDPYMDQLRELVLAEDPFCDDAGYISVCKYKTEASASGGALMYLDEFVQTISTDEAFPERSD